MNLAATIMALISIVACLFLATRSSELTHLPGAAKLRLALIWSSIIGGLYLAFRFLGISG